MNDLSVCASVRYVHASVCPVHCGKMADRIRMPLGIIGRTGPGMRQVVGFGDRSMRRGTFGANLGRSIVTQWGRYAIRVWQCCDVAFFPNCFRKTCCDTNNHRCSCCIDCYSYHNTLASDAAAAAYLYLWDGQQVIWGRVCSAHCVMPLLLYSF